MAEIQLSDYLAFVFSEISRARDMADRYSKEIALVYAKDDVLRHFSVPRFKLAKLELDMPVLVSGVDVSSLTKFQMTRDAFRSAVLSNLVDLVAAVLAGKTGTNPDPVKGSDRVRPVRTDGIDPLIDAFFGRLAALPDLTSSEELISSNWTDASTKMLAINDIPPEESKGKPVSDLISRSLPTIVKIVKSNVTVSKATIQRLQINPQTNAVKDGSTDTSVFTIRAELIEEGVLIKSIRDERTGAESPVVEFE